MIVETCQIMWHEKKPVFSCEFHPSDSLGNLVATGGADCVVRLWRLKTTTATTGTSGAARDHATDAQPAFGHPSTQTQPEEGKRKRPQSGGPSRPASINKHVQVEYVAGLTKHGRAVNCVRFCANYVHKGRAKRAIPAAPIASEGVTGETEAGRPGESSGECVLASAGDGTNRG